MNDIERLHTYMMALVERSYSPDQIVRTAKEMLAAIVSESRDEPADDSAWNHAQFVHVARYNWGLSSRTLNVLWENGIRSEEAFLAFDPSDPNVVGNWRRWGSQAIRQCVQAQLGLRGDFAG